MVNFPFHVHRIARKDESQCGTKAAKAGTGCICESHDKTLHNHNQYTRAKDIQASNEEDRWDVFAGWPLDVDKLLSHLTVDRRSNWIINVDPCCGLMITSFDDSIIIIIVVDIEVLMYAESLCDQCCNKTTVTAEVWLRRCVLLDWRRSKHTDHASFAPTSRRLWTSS